MEENFIILGLRKKNRLVIHKHLRCMDVPIAVAADIKKNVSINMMMKKMQLRDFCALKYIQKRKNKKFP